MSVNTAQITVSSSVATQVIVPGTSAGQFNNTTGTVTDPIPSLIQNIDPSIVIYIGRQSTVSTTTGFPVAAGATIPISWINTDAPTLYAIAASGAPKLAVFLGRQN